MATTEKKQKKSKPFLKWGLILLGFAAILGAIYFGFGLLTLTRDLIAVTLIGGATYGGYRGVKKAFTTRASEKENTASNKLKRTRKQERELTQGQERDTLPSLPESIQTEAGAIDRDDPTRKIEVEYIPSNTKTTKNNGR